MSLPFLASSSHCLVINRYLGDSGHTGSKINCNTAGHIANPVNSKKMVRNIQSTAKKKS